MASINYDDKRFAEVETERQEALSENEQLYEGMVNQSDSFYQGLADESKEWAEKQSQIQQEQTDFAIDQIEQQKAQAEKDYIKEQKGAYKDWQKQSNQYGAQAEQIAASGLGNTGFSESSKVGMYNTYQNRVATTRESFDKVILNYNNNITEARLQNNSALAEIAHNSLQQQLQFLLEGFQYKNQLLQEEANKKLTINSMYDSKYQAVVDQINTENALAEQQRQYNEQMALEREQLAYQKAQDQKSYALQQAQLAFQREQWEYEKAQAEKESSENVITNERDGGSSAPLSKSYVTKVMQTVSKLGGSTAQLNYLKGLYENKKISEANLKYFLNECGL